VPQALVEGAQVVPLALAEKVNDLLPCWPNNDEPPIDLPVDDDAHWECMTWADAARRQPVQLRGLVYLQSNEWPAFERLDWRVQWRDDDGLHAGPWQPVPGHVANAPPTPVTLLVDDATEWRVLWHSSSGICCPAETHAWITRADVASPGAVSYASGPVYDGGGGQPCD